MKRGTFKKKPISEIATMQDEKRKKLLSTIKDKKSSAGGKILTKKPKVQSVSQLKKKLWEECKRIIRAKYIVSGKYTCFTCGKNIENMSSVHTSHFIPSAACGTYLRYDLRNLRICCYFCNVNLGGNGSMYYRRLVETEGQEYVDQLFKDKNITIKADSIWYQNKLEEYKSL